VPKTNKGYAKQINKANNKATSSNNKKQKETCNKKRQQAETSQKGARGGAIFPLTLYMELRPYA
jgi:hypothetical protein